MLSVTFFSTCKNTVEGRVGVLHGDEKGDNAILAHQPVLVSALAPTGIGHSCRWGSAARGRIQEETTSESNTVLAAQVGIHHSYGT
jgi:hypothetical protein